MPQSWKTYKLGDLSDITMGQSPKGIDTNKSGEGLPLLNGPTEFGYSQPTPTQYTTDPKKVSNSGDLLFCVRGSTTGRMNFSNIPYAIGRGLCSFRGMNGYSTRFIKYLIDYELSNLLNITTGSTFPNLNKNDINGFKVKSPDYKEANKIAQILSAIDDKIENNLAINKTLEEMAMALYKHWFVDFGPFQDGAFVESELGEIPEGWEVKRIGDLIEVVNGYAFKSKDFKEQGEIVLKIKNISNNIVDINSCSLISSELSKTVNNKFQVSEGDFLIAMTGAEVGKVGVVPNYNQPLWLNQRVGKLKDKSLENSSILIGKILQLDEYYEVIQNLAYGSAQPNISGSGIESIEIALPSNIDILKDLVNEFVISHKNIISNLTENQTLTQLRDTLLPKLISGEVRLKEFQEQTASVL